MDGRRSEPRAYELGAGLSRYIWLLWVIWLAFLAYPLQALFDSHPSQARVAVVLGAAALFSATYIWNVVRSLQRVRVGSLGYNPWPALLLLVALALGLTIGDRKEWIELFIFVIVSFGPALPARLALAGIGMFAVLAPILGHAVGGTPIQIAQMVFQSAVSGIAVIIVVRVIVLDRELRAARQEIARLAVDEERLRFARDLHDLLGHSLSLIALKSELIARLIPVAPDRALQESRDVEEVARRALHDVREAVAGYRQPGLATEIENARQVLAAAGIDMVCDGEPDGLLPAQDAVLGWAVREGVTNVVKHSRAKCCTVRICHDSGAVGVDILDDGTGRGSGEGGSGLPGLAERAAALGGRCEGGPRPDGGFCLSVRLPASSGQRVIV